MDIPKVHCTRYFLITFCMLALRSNHLHSSSDCIPHPFLVSAECGAAEQCWRWDRSLEVTGPMTH